MSYQQQFPLMTKGHGDMHDITEEVAAIVISSGIRTGAVSPSKAQREMIPNELCDSDGQLTQSISLVENYWSVHSSGATAANPALPSGATRSARFLGVLKDAEVLPYPISPTARRL
jgi:hypothetical protein